MIKYRRRALPIFERYFHEEVAGSITFVDWLKEQGARHYIQDDFTVAAMNVIVFEKAEDEVAFRLKWDIK